MRKIRRNDSCPCGSGKKYKRCCGQNIAKHESVDQINNELYRVYQELISTTTKYDNKINELHEKYDYPSFGDEETGEIYHTGLTPWFMSSVPSFKNNDTILKRLYRTNQKKLSLRAKNLLVKWLHATPSVYEVVAVQSPNKQFMTVKEIQTEESFYIPIQNADDFITGSLLVGIVIPFAQHYNFLLTMVKLYDRDKQFFLKLLNQFGEKEGGISEHFPEFLVDSLSSDSLETAWDDPAYQAVATLLTEHLSKKGVNDRVITESINHWNSFCQKENPTIKRVEPYAAALDYYIQKTMVNNNDITQADIAKEYSTSSSTLSNIYRRLIEALT